MFFGRQCYRSVDVLLQMASDAKVPIRIKSGLLYNMLKTYVHIFGMPDVGYQLRAEYFKKYSRKLVGKNILDAGCGLGLYSFSLARKYPDATIDSFDYDQRLVSAGIRILNSLRLENVKVFQADLQKLSANGKYDLIICQDVIEHVDDDRLAISNLGRALKKGGALYLTTPHERHTRRRLGKLGVTYDGGGHVREGYTEARLSALLTDNGFEMVKMRNVWGFWGEICEESYRLAVTRFPLPFAALLFPFLALLSLIDMMSKNKNGSGLIVIARKRGAP